MINAGASLSLIKIEAVEIARIPRRRNMRIEATILIYMKPTVSSSIKIGSINGDYLSNPDIGLQTCLS